MIHDSPHGGADQQREDSLTEEQEIQRIKEQIRVKVKLPDNRLDEVAEMIQTTDRLCKGGMISQEESYKDELTDASMSHGASQPLELQDNLDAAFVKNIHESFRQF